MTSIYALVKKLSSAHKALMASPKFKNDSVIAVGSTHVFIPAVRSIDIGHNVSHAKNRTRRARFSNLQAVTLDVGESKKQIRITARDKRTLAKLTK